jgi:cytochrome c-type biogenesis protein
MTEGLSLFLVFAAGLLSFLSPCVLPLIPSYLGILGALGLSAKTDDEEETATHGPRLFLAALAFVLGFSGVFITLGILVSTTFFLMGGVTVYINRAAGIIVIVLGLNVIFDFLSFLNYEKRPFFKQWPRLGAMPAAFVAGAAFGTGWTPCVGPILTGILLLAARDGKIATSIFYLVVYSAGLALPFLLAALFFDSFLKHASRLSPHLPLIRRISGVLLIMIGITILIGRYSVLNELAQKLVFSYIDWAGTKALPFRLLARALAWIQNF